MNDIERLELTDRLIGPKRYEPLWDDPKHYSPGGQPHHFDRKGNPLTFREWGTLREFGGKEYVVVKQEYVENYWISTVWLGMNHSFNYGPPLIFETMVFNKAYDPPPPLSETLKDGGKYPEYTSSTDLDCERYATEEEAIEGHERMVEKVRLIVEATRRETDGA